MRRISRILCRDENFTEIFLVLGFPHDHSGSGSCQFAPIRFESAGAPRFLLPRRAPLRRYADHIAPAVPFAEQALRDKRRGKEAQGGSPVLEFQPRAFAALGHTPRQTLSKPSHSM